MGAQPCHVQKSASHNILPCLMGLTFFLTWYTLNLGRWLMSHFWLRIQQLLIISALVSLVSALTTAFCKTNLLWPRLRAALIHGYKHNYLEDGLTTCSFSKTIVWIPTPMAYVLQRHGLWSGTCHEFLPMEQASNPIIKQLVTPITVMPLL